MSCRISPHLLGIFVKERHMRFLATFTITLLIATPGASGSIVVEHTGANDPTTEGWTLTDDSGGSNIYGPVFDDLGYMDAWRLDTFTNGADGDLLYRRALSGGELNDAITQGWALTSQARLVQAAEGGLTLRFASGSAIYDLYMWGNPADADPTISLLGDTRTVTLQGGGGAYHLFRMADEDADGLADIFIDGQLVFPDYPGMTSAYGAEVQFGDFFSHSQDGHALYAQVGFEIVPEPATALLLGAAGLVALRRR